MKILFLMPGKQDAFPKPDSSTTFADWLAFSDRHDLYTKVNYFDSLEDLQKGAKKDPLAPILICSGHTGLGNRLHFMKRQGKRMYGINNHDYARPNTLNTYVIPMECDTFDELRIMIERLHTDKRLTTGFLKASAIGFRDGKPIEE